MRSSKILPLLWKSDVRAAVRDRPSVGLFCVLPAAKEKSMTLAASKYIIHAKILYIVNNLMRLYILLQVPTQWGQVAPSKRPPPLYLMPLKPKTL